MLLSGRPEVGARPQQCGEHRGRQEELDVESVLPVPQRREPLLGQGEGALEVGPAARQRAAQGRDCATGPHRITQLVEHVPGERGVLDGSLVVAGAVQLLGQL